MRRSKDGVVRAIESFESKLIERFAGLSFDRELDPGDGFDAWVYVFVPNCSPAAQDEVRQVARQLEMKAWRENKVGLMAMIRQKEPVHG